MNIKSFLFKRRKLEKRRPLAISRCRITGSENLFLRLDDGDGHSGLGELAAANMSDGETAAAGEKQLSSFLGRNLEPLSIYELMREACDSGVPPRARACLDMALWDLFAQQCEQPLHRVFGLARTGSPTSVTVGIESPEQTYERVTEILQTNSPGSVKIKLGNPAGIEADRHAYLAAKQAADQHQVPLRADANGGWSLKEATVMCQWLAEQGCDYIEQPLPPSSDQQLAELHERSPIPVFIDESCHLAADIPPLAEKVDGINVKLMKCGGLTEAMRLVAVARAHGLKLMLGCMGESSVAISAAVSISSLFDYIDLDSHLNLRNDPADGAALVSGTLVPPHRPGHGAVITNA